MFPCNMEMYVWSKLLFLNQYIFNSGKMCKIIVGARDATTSKERNLFGSDHLFRSKYHDLYIDIFGGKCS